MLSSRPRHLVALLSPAAVGLALACVPPDDPAITAPTNGAPSRVLSVSNDTLHQQNPAGAVEGEIFGAFYVNGNKWADTLTVTLGPRNAATTGRLRANYSGIIQSYPTFRLAFEWWDPASDEQPCARNDHSLANWFTMGPGHREVPHADTAGALDEAHCVRPGEYTFAGGPLDAMPVDYLQTATASITDASSWAYVVENATYDANSKRFTDLIIHHDETSTHPGETQVLEIQAVASCTDATFTPAASPNGTANTCFRFSAGKSAAGWTIDPAGSVLARLYWDASTPSIATSTGYYTPTSDSVRILRIHKFPNPATDSAIHVVGLEVLTPDEYPDNTPTVTDTIIIHRINSNLTGSGITFAGGTVTAGSAFSVTVPVSEATGNASVESGWKMTYYLSTDTLLGAGDVRMGGLFTEDSVTKGGSRNITRSVTVPGDVPANNYYVLAKLDTTNVIIESNEGDNVVRSATTKAVAAAPAIAVGITFGPSNVRKNVQCEWDAVAANDFAPTEWRWIRNADTVSTDANYGVFNTGPGGGFMLKVLVRDVYGRVAMDSMAVTQTGTPPVCVL